MNTQKIPSSSTGAAGEMLVSADLLSKGLEVFRAVSGGASCDLVAWFFSAPLKIEVKTNTSKLKTRAKVKADILARVNLETKKIRYFHIPEMTEAGFLNGREQ